MCQAIADGGRRCPRHRRDSIVAMQFASTESGLPLESVNEVFTELRREARHVPMSGMEDSYEQVITTLQEQARDANVSQRYRDILSEFDQDAAPASDTLYALTRLRRRTIEQSTQLHNSLGDLANRAQVTLAEVRSYYDQARSEASNSTAADEHTADDVVAAYEGGLPTDPASITAHKRTAARFGLGPRGDALISEGDRVMWLPVDPNSTDHRVAGYGYHRESGRLEVYTSTGDTIPYRAVPESLVRDWSSPSDASYGALSLQGDPAHQYDSPRQAAEHSHAYQCQYCGQFRALSHTCPEREVVDQLMAENPERSRESVTIEEVRGILNAREEEATAAATVVPDAPQDGDTERILALQNGVTPLLDSDTRVGVRTVDADDPHNTLTMSPTAVAEMQRRGIRYVKSMTKQEILVATRRSADITTLSSGLSLAEVEALPDNSRFMYGERYSYDYATGERRYSIYISPSYNGDTHLYAGYSGEPAGWIGVGHTSQIEEGVSISLARRGQVDPTRYANRAAHSQAHLENLESFNQAHGENVAEVDSVTNFTRDYRIQGSIASRIAWAKKPQFRRAINDGKVVVAPITWSQNSGGAQIDEFGYDIDSQYDFTVQGNLGMKKNDDGTFAVLTPDTSLRCTCPVYRNNYHCTHIDYVRNHAPKVGQQMMRTAPRQAADPGVHGVPVSVVNHRNATINHDEETGRTEVSFTTRPSDQYRPNHMRFSQETLEQERDVITAARMANMAQGTLYTPPATIVARAARNADTVAAPFTVTSLRDPFLSSNRWHNSYTLSGVRRLTRGDDGEVTQSVEQLRCSCGRFASETGCVHTELFAQHQNELLTVDTSFDYYAARQQSNALQSAEDENRIEQFRTAYMRLDRGEITVEQLDEAIAEEEERQELIRIEEMARREEARRERAREQEERRRRMAMSMAERKAQALAEFQQSAPEYESYRSGQKELWQNVDERYGDNTEAVKQLIQETQAQSGAIGEVVGYRTENVTDGVCDPNVPGSRRFGVELEFVLPGRNKAAKLDAIATELHEAGLADRATMGGYHSGQRSGWASWNLESDCTVDGELVSPLMADSPEHWEQLSKALEILKRHGAQTSTKAGSHVHVSSGSFGGKLAKGVEVLRTVEENEDILFRAAADPKTGAHRGTEWCAPNVSTSSFGDVTKEQYDTEGEYDSTVLYRHTSHSNMLNFEGSVGMTKKAHIEYRLWDASLDAATIQKQVMASVAITEAADRDTEANDGVSPAREVAPEQKYGAAKRRLGKTKDVDESSVKNVASFVDRVFRRKEDREDFIRLFATRTNA